MGESNILRWGQNARLENKKLARHRLIQAAYESFVIKGIQETSISDVTTLAKVSRGTFYQYFSGKKDLRKSVLQYSNTRLFDDLVMFVLPHAKTPSRMFEEAVVFASAYQQLPIERNGVVQKSKNDLLTLLPFELQEDWRAGWREAFNRIYMLHYEASMSPEALNSLAELASHLVLVYRLLEETPRNIRRNLESFRSYALFHDGVEPDS